MHYAHGLGTMMGSGYGIGMMVVWALILIGIVALVIWLASRASRNPQAHRESPLEILKVRYARGEIDQEEYHKRLEELRR